ncbi:MAG: hypothetical protein HY000_11445 [Planctomycetes bacterium]|nr:hypothetical protein [Planctomycetota bacterium]
MTMWEGFGRFSVLGPRDLRTIAVENFESFDRDHDGKLSRDELPAWIRPQIPRIDVNRDGFLDQAEVATILERIPQLSQYHRRNGLVWLPLCVLGLAWAVRDGWLQFQSGRIPQPWALVWYTAVIAAVVVLLIPLNWDRYYLPLQACSALLVPYGIAATLNWMGSRLVLRPAAAQRT